MIVEVVKEYIVYYERLSRLVKNLKDIIDIVKQLQNKGVRVIIFKEGIDIYYQLINIVGYL